MLRTVRPPGGDQGGAGGGQCDSYLGRDECVLL